MKIIQSFAKYEEGSPYLRNNNICLNFYSFLLSYLTLNKYYGHVTMICNKQAYDAFIKYIPYDEIIFLENKYSFDFWSAYKIDALRLIDEDVIHVDTDVFIFDDHFKPFIFGNYDIICQDITWNNVLGINYVKYNAEFLKDSGIIDPNAYDGGFTSCGVLGIKNHVKNAYYNIVDMTYDAMINNKIKNIETRWFPVILEELNLYFAIINKKFNAYGILPSDLIKEIGTQDSGNRSKYTHLWFSNKFDAHYIDLIKRKIRTDFPRHGFRINNFEADLIKQGIL